MDSAQRNGAQEAAATYQAWAAQALARAGDTAGAEKLAAEINKAGPLDTPIQRYWLPTIRAAVALERKDPKQAVVGICASTVTEPDRCREIRL